MYNAGTVSGDTRAQITRTGMLVECAQLLKRSDFDAKVNVMGFCKLPTCTLCVQALSTDAQRTWAVKAVLSIIHNCLGSHTGDQRLQQFASDAKRALCKMDILNVNVVFLII
jgi:hypothetical protein